MQELATGADLVKNAVRAAIGEPVTSFKPLHYNGCWADVILHSSTNGVFERLEISDSLLPYVVEKDMWVSKGDIVHVFTGANEAIGTLVLRFDSQEQLENMMSTAGKEVRVVTQ